MREMADINVSINKKASLELPEKVDSNVGKTLVTFANAIKDITCASKNVVNATIHGTATLFAPLKAICEGKAAELEEKYAYKAEEYRKLKSNLALGIDVLKNLNDKEKNGEKIPDKIEDTDPLFSIQEAASETLDKDFISFWSKLYTEEACKPGTINKKAINLCKDLNKDIVKILEDIIFPYCDDQGFFLGDRDKSIRNILEAQEYGFIKDCEIIIPPSTKENINIHSISNYLIWVFPGYNYGLGEHPKMLTVSALSIRKCLNLKKEIDPNIVKSSLIENSQNWKIAEYFKGKIVYQPEITDKFLLSEAKTLKILFPEKYAGKLASDIVDGIFSKIEFKD